MRRRRVLIAPASSEQPDDLFRRHLAGEQQILVVDVVSSLMLERLPT